MEFPADYTEVSDWVDPLKSFKKKISPVSHHLICNIKRAKQERWIKKQLEII